MKRIHIVGSGPRTGTTLLAELMINCFEIDLYYNHEAHISAYPPSKGKIFLSKHPSDLFAIDLPLKIFHNLYVLCIIRDPRDAIVSKHGRYPDLYWGGLRYWKALMPIWERLKKHPRFLTIKYEYLVKNPNKIQEKIKEFIPELKLKSLFSDYHKIAKPSEKSLNALKGLRSISTKGIGNWEHHLSRIAHQLSIHGSISNDLIYHGYEIDSDWENKLNNVKPIEYNSFWPEYFEKVDLRKRKNIKYKAIFVFTLLKIGINWYCIKKKLKEIIKY